MHLFCDNDTNTGKLYGADKPGYFKDGIHEFLVHGNLQAVNYQQGTKAALNYDKRIPGGSSVTIRLRLSHANPFLPPSTISTTFSRARIRETDSFYADLQAEMTSDTDEKLVQRQAFAGMLWNKQLYYYNVEEWLKGDPLQPPLPRTG